MNKLSNQAIGAFVMNMTNAISELYIEIKNNIITQLLISIVVISILLKTGVATSYAITYVTLSVIFLLSSITPLLSYRKVNYFKNNLLSYANELVYLSLAGEPIRLTKLSIKEGISTLNEIAYSNHNYNIQIRSLALSLRPKVTILTMLSDIFKKMQFASLFAAIVTLGIQS